MAVFEMQTKDGKRFQIEAPNAESAAASFKEHTGGEGTAAKAIDFAGETLSNVPGSAVNAAKDIGRAVIHPVETATNMADLGMGVMQKLGVLSGTDYEKYPEAVGKFLVDRYGSVDNALNTLKTDPVGMALDISTVFSGGESLAARAPGVVGKLGKISGTIGRATDPLNAIAKAGKGAAELVGGLGTHTGSDAIKLAFQAGRQGGEAGEKFRENMRGTAPMTDAVNDAKAAVAQLRKERGASYREGMKDVGGDTTVLSFDELDKAANDMDKVATYKGQSLSPSTEAIRSRITDEIEKWKALPAKEFHTAEGFDALKRRIGDIRDATQFGTKERVVADEAYQAIKKTIVNQAPKYAKVMKGYEEASDLIREMEKTLSVNPKASVDTTLRKLQSVLRDNVNTSFGRRRELAEFLVNAGAPNLMEKLAGQALASWSPRGLGKVAAGVEAVQALYSHSPWGALYAAPILAASSPRVVGEISHALGRGAGVADKLPLQAIEKGGFQAGRLDQISNDDLTSAIAGALP